MEARCGRSSWFVAGVLLWICWLNGSSAQGQQTASVERLIGLLQQRLPVQRIAAARRLAEMGTQAQAATAALTACLQDPTSDVRVVAAFALSRVSNDGLSSIESLLPLLADANEHVRYSAQWSVAQLATDMILDLDENQSIRVIQLLEQALSQLKRFEHQPRHYQAIEAVLMAVRTPIQQNTAAAPPEKKDDRELIRLVEQFYTHNDLISRMQVIRRLRDQPDASSMIRKRVLQSELYQPDPILLDYAIASWKDSATPILSELFSELKLDTAEPDYSAGLIQRLLPDNATMVGRLGKLACQPQLPAQVRIAAAHALTRSRHDAQGCATVLAELLNDAEIQTEIAELLAQMGAAARVAESPLIAALSQTTDEAFQMSGSLALAKIASNSPITANYLIEWLREMPPDSSVRPTLIEAVTSLGALALPAIELLKQQLSSPDLEQRLAAASALRALGAQARSAVPELVHRLTSTTEESVVKVQAAQAIAQIGQEAVSQLLAAFKDQHTAEVTEDLLRALALSESSAIAGRTICTELLTDEYQPISVRAAAACTLGAMGPEAAPAIPALLTYCQVEQDEVLHAMCLLAIARIEPSSIAEFSKQQLNCSSPLIQASAAFALHLNSESQLAFETLLGMLNEGEADWVVKAMMLEMGSVISPWLIDQVSNAERSMVQQLTCCELACQLPSPNWSELLKLVDQPYWGEQYTYRLSSYWHPEIACKIEQRLDEVEVLAELLSSTEVSAVGKARLASLLMPDGLGAGDDSDSWGGPVLTNPESVAALQIGVELPKLALPEVETPVDNSVSSPMSAGRWPLDDLGLAAIEPSSAGHSEPPATAPHPTTEKNRQVELFYGTNRQRELSAWPVKKITTAVLVATLGCAAVLILSVYDSWRRNLRLRAVLSVSALFLFSTFGLYAVSLLSILPSTTRIAYSSRLSDHIEYGRCVVTIPPNHRPGVVEAPLLLKGQLVTDPNRHVVLQSVDSVSPEQFIADLREAQHQKGKNLLVFIHGYNVSFEDAAKRTAQMAYDLEFPGAPIFYSWPSQANWYGYRNDQRQMEQSVSSIKGFLEQLARQSGADTINLVAHSMGNIGLTAALQQITSPPGSPYFNQVVLAAPDVDAQVFQRDIAPKIVTKAKRLTLYTSQNDLALVASRYFNNAARLGDSGAGVITYPGIETIDASAVDSSLLGHSYYGSNISVLTDVGQLLQGQPISHRDYLQQVERGDQAYWAFAPQRISRSPAPTNQPIRQ